MRGVVDSYFFEIVTLLAICSRIPLCQQRGKYGVDIVVLMVIDKVTSG